MGATGVFRPKLILDGDALFVRMDAGDMLGEESVRSLCFASRHPGQRLLLSPEVSRVQTTPDSHHGIMYRITIPSLSSTYLSLSVRTAMTWCPC